MSDPRVIAALKSVGCDNPDPTSIKKLLTAIASSGSAKANRHDMILLGALNLIESFEKVIVSADYTGTSGDRS